MKKKNVMIITAAVLVCAITITGIARAVRGGGSAVDVTQVSYLNSGWWDEGTSTSGYVTANASQDVYLESDSVVEKVYVKKGDKVKIGDTLLEYDKTLLQLNLEKEQINKQIQELELQGAKNDLEKLKKITPVPDREGGSSGVSPLDEPDDSSDDLDDSGADGYEEARAAIVKHNVSLVSTAAGADVQVIDGNSDGSDSTGTAGGETTQQTESQTPESTTPSTEPAYPAETESEPETEEETEDSPLAKTKAYQKLDYKTKYYKGSGTKSDPYVYLCKEGAEVSASFMNKILGFNTDGSSRKEGGINKDGKGCYAVLQIREGDSLAGGFIKSVTVNGTIDTDKAYAPDVTWIFSSKGITKKVPDIQDPQIEEPEEPWEPDDPGDNPFEPGDGIYTVSELKKAIAEKEKEIAELELDIRDAEVSVSQAQRKLDEATIKATINGVVKTVGDPKVGQVDGEAFLTVTSNKGMYVKGSISEMDLGNIGVGSTITGTAQESGTPITAEITEISKYPSNADGNSYGGDSNPNASSYPFTAYIEDSDDLINHEYVDIQIEGNGGNGSSVYLPKALIRMENGQSYVYIEGKNKKLKKQYVRTGQTLYSTYIEVKEGVSETDWIAFPYGKAVKEGAPVKELEGSGFADQLN